MIDRLPKCLEGTSVPTNVRFLFNFKREGGVSKEVIAHKQILAIMSDVFAREFFESMKEADEEDIVVEDARQEVFKAMIEYIYNKKKDLTDYDLGFRSSLYYLADKYDIEELRKAIIDSIRDYVVSDENVLDVAIMAEENILHQALSEALYDVAALFLQKKIAETHGLVLLKLMARMERLSAHRCENCPHIPCQNGKNVNIGSIAPEAKALVSFEILSLHDPMLKRLGDIVGPSGGFNNLYAGLAVVFGTVQSIK
jgi:hypothetical protein